MTDPDDMLLIRDLAAEVRALREYVDAHQALEHLIADHTDDRVAYNAAVERLNAAAAAVDRPPTGTPDEPRNHRCTFSLPADLLDQLEEEAGQRMLSRSKFVELLLWVALANLPPVKPDTGDGT